MYVPSPSGGVKVPVQVPELLAEHNKPHSLITAGQRFAILDPYNWTVFIPVVASEKLLVAVTEALLIQLPLLILPSVTRSETPAGIGGVLSIVMLALHLSSSQVVAVQSS